MEAVLRSVLFVSGAIAVAACAGATKPPAPSTPGVTASRIVSSNTLFDDYAGTQSCAKCHAERVRTWLASPMHNMTREIEGAEVKGPFDGTVFRFKDDTAKLETINGARFVTLSSKKYGDGKYRVTRVIGGHYREDYAGVAVGGSPEEMVLPVSYVFTTKALRYKGYSVMIKERDGLHAGPVWGETCIFCHNTPPYFSTVLGALAGPSAKAYQGQVLDPLLPRERRVEWKVKDASALASAIDHEVQRLGHRSRGDGSRTLAQGVNATRSSFRRQHLVETGIGCEACHLGSAEHVKDPTVLPTFEPRSAAFEAQLPKTKDSAEVRAQRINRICARCHQVLFSGYEPTWEGGSRHGNAGGSNINSGEARDMMLGACASRLTCVECHEPHASDATAKLRALPAAEKDALCTRCHDKYAAPAALRAHAHHDPVGEGGRCLSCHMPKKNLSLDGVLTRYHRIGSPTDPPRVILDRPLECATCHADKSVESIVTTMETWWKRSFDRDALTRLYGDLGANVVVATANRGKPHEQAVAFFLLGERKDKAAIPHLVPQLTHPYPLVRGYAKRALDTIAGAPVPIDIDADDAAIESQARAFYAR